MTTGGIKAFTLVELMVVVAIIGILSSISIPAFRKYQAKSKTTEAKLTLSSIYQAEQGFFAQHDVYHKCLSIMGYQPGDQRYYTSGFPSRGTPWTITEVPTCINVDVDGYNYWSQNKAVAGATVTGANAFGPAAITQSTFQAVACGNIDSEHIGAICNGALNAPDSWTINQDKNLQHRNIGY